MERLLKLTKLMVLIVGAAAVAAFVAAATTAAPYGQCHSQSRYLGNNPNDESDSWSHNNHMAKCQYGQRANEQTAREIETWKAGRQEWLTAKADPRRKPSDDWDRRAYAQAQPQYRNQGVSMVDICRGLATTRAGGISQAKMRDCMAGKIAQR